MTRTVWTSEEKAQIFTRVEEFFREHPRAPRRLALQTGQLALDASRRVVITDQRVHNYRDRIEIARQNANRKKAPSIAPPEPVETPAAIPTPPRVPEPRESTTERLASIFEQLLDVLADKVADRVAQRLQIEVQTTTHTAAPHRPRHNPEPVSQPRQCRPGVVILGLLPQTGELLRREFGHRLDVVWYDSDDASKRNVHPMAHVVLMTKFINHGVQERWRKAGMLHYCNGGATELRQILANL